MAMTPLSEFQGGPLDGTRIEKHLPGRTPVALSGAGVSVPAPVFYRMAQTEQAPSVYRLSGTRWEDGIKISVYMWQGENS